MRPSPTFPDKGLIGLELKRGCQAAAPLLALRRRSAITQTNEHGNTCYETNCGFCAHEQATPELAYICNTTHTIVGVQTSHR